MTGPSTDPSTGPSTVRSSSGVTGAGIWWAATGPVEGPLVVLVHGTMDRSGGLLKLARRLHDRCRVVRYDRRGYGRSARAAPDYRCARHLDDLVDVIDAVDAIDAVEAVDALDEPPAGRRSSTLFGHSYGGNVALSFAARHPDVTRAVAVYETPLSWLEWWPADSAGGAALELDDPGDAAELFMRRMIGDARWERLPPSTRSDRRGEGRAMVGELADLRTVAPWSPDRVIGPVVAMSGARGRSHHRDSVRYLERHLPDCRSVVVDGAAHAGPNTHPDAVARIVAELSGIDG